MARNGAMEHHESQRLKKRRKVGGIEASSEQEAGPVVLPNSVNDDENDANLKRMVKLIDGEDFVSDEQRQEAEAQRRRAIRRQRLKQSLLSMVKSEEVQNTMGRRADVAVKLESSAEQGSQDESAICKRDADDDDDAFDMFSSSVSPVAKEPGGSIGTGTTKRGHEQADWDDAEGYYKAVIGETITLDQRRLPTEGHSPSSDGALCFRVLGVIGKGVFSTVLKCTTVSNTTSMTVPPVVAIKCIRHNDTMAKTALKELQTLLRLKGSPGIVPLLLPTTASPLEHRGHVVMGFSFMEYNLRDVLQKFGKGVGLSLQAVRSYFGQMLAAATHLQKHNIIHADLKPDNILVSADFGVVQLADFGSAFDVNSPENQPTPYLVSRFYRAPEIILGLAPTHAIDLWSLAVTVAELFLGEVLFRGKSNNDMLYVFMQHMGAFTNRVIRQHMVQCNRLAIPRHFHQEGTTYSFTQQTVDSVSGTAVHNVVSLVSSSSNENKFPLATPFHPKLMKAKSAKDSRRMVSQFSDLLQKCLTLDPTRRIALKESLRHEFFQSQDATQD